MAAAYPLRPKETIIDTKMSTVDVKMDTARLFSLSSACISN
jgi:hypothetical protein